MVTRNQTSNSFAFDDAEVKSSADIGYVIHKLLQNYNYLEPFTTTTYLTQVYTRPDNDSDWVLTFQSTNDEPEDEPLTKLK